jgi:hypothetical protein
MTKYPCTDTTGRMHAAPVDHEITMGDKLKELPYPHYSDPKWDHACTVCGKEEPGLFYNYDDRLRYHEQHPAAKAAADKAFPKHPRTPAWWQAYLAAFHGKPCDLRHVLAGTNRSNGFAYYVFGYIVGKEGEA